MLHFPPWKIALVVIVCALSIIFSAPNLISREQAEALPKWVPHLQVNLGLDLRGGSSLLLEVDTRAVITERLENIIEGLRTEMRQARIGYTELGVTAGNVSFRLRDAGQAQAALEIVKKLALPVGGGGALGLGTGRVDISWTAASDGLVTIVLSEEAVKERSREAVAQSIEIVRRRIDETGVNEPSIQRSGNDRILVQLPGVDDPDRIKRLLGKTAKLAFRMVDESANPADGRAPAGSDLLDADSEKQLNGQPVKYVVRKRVDVAGENLTKAQAGTDQRSGQWVVNFGFDTVGAKRFGEITRDNVGKRFAIVLDNKVISAPVIREPILGGSGQISGNFTSASANDLAVLLRAGALPAPLKIIEERTVGPDLGSDSIRAGVIAVFVGFFLVVVYMVAAYGLFGFFADVALLFNLTLTIGALSLLQATLTLPGIAGILLTLGMSVDANVLINERIREETRLGKSPMAAMEAGFSRAFSTIVDANLTSLIKMVILYALGSGPVKGFAVTISLGILTSMFTATVLVRLMMVTWLRRTRPKMLAA